MRVPRALRLFACIRALKHFQHEMSRMQCRAWRTRRIASVRADGEAKAPPGSACLVMSRSLRQDRKRHAIKAGLISGLKASADAKPRAGEPDAGRLMSYPTGISFFVSSRLPEKHCCCCRHPYALTGCRRRSRGAPWPAAAIANGYIPWARCRRRGADLRATAADHR